MDLHSHKLIFQLTDFIEVKDENNEIFRRIVKYEIDTGTSKRAIFYVFAVDKFLGGFLEIYSCDLEYKI